MTTIPKQGRMIKTLGDCEPRFRSEVHHRQALFEMRAQARIPVSAPRCTTARPFLK